MKIRDIKASVREIHVPARFYRERCEPELNDELLDDRRNVLERQIVIGVLHDGIVPRTRDLVNEAGIFFGVLAFFPNAERRAGLCGNAAARRRDLFPAVGKANQKDAVRLLVVSRHLQDSFRLLAHFNIFFTEPQRNCSVFRCRISVLRL